MCPGWSQRRKDPLKGELTTWINNELWYCCLAFGVSAATTGKKNPEVDPSFLERSYLGLNAAVCREGLCHACIDGMLPSIHLCCLLCCECQTQRLWHSPPFQPPPLYASYPTWPSSSPGLPDEQSLLPGAPVLQMSPIIMLLQMSNPGLLAHVCSGVWCMVLGGRVSCVAATAFHPSLRVIKCINV